MARKRYPKRDEKLEEYKRKYLDQLNMVIHHKEFKDFEKEILNDPELGITLKRLHDAQDEALLERKKKLQHQRI